MTHKKSKVFTIVLVIITILVCFLITKLPEPTTKQPETPKELIVPDEPITDTIKTLTYWDAFYEALIFVESNNNLAAVNSRTGALGLIQSLPEGCAGYIDEANKILGYKKFTNELLLSDAEANRECFEIVNNKHNPTKNLELAIKLHNPKAGKSYANTIYRKMDKIVEEYRNNPSINYIHHN